MTTLTITFTGSQIITIITAVVVSMATAIGVLYKQFVYTIDKSEQDCEKRMFQYSQSLIDTVKKSEQQIEQRYEDYKSIAEQRYIEFKEVTDSKIQLLEKSLEQTRQDRARDHEEVKMWKMTDKKKIFSILTTLHSEIEFIKNKLN